MTDRLDHCAKFARSLALATTMLACSSSADDPPPNDPPAQSIEATASSTEGPAETNKSDQDVPGSQADASTQAEPAKDGGARISGPLPPPELPTSLA